MKIVTLTLNPCFDITYYFDAFDEEDVNRVTRERLESGGKGLNVSIVLGRLGVKNSAVILAGRESAERYQKHIPADAAGLEFIYTSGKIRENMTLSSPGKCVKINKSGFSCGKQEIDSIKNRLSELISRDTVLVISGSFPDGTSFSETSDIVRHARNLGARLAMDTSALTGTEIIRLKPWLIKPNEHELAAMTEMPVQTDAQIAEAAEKLRSQGVQNILVSLGERGIYYSGEEGAVRAGVPDVQLCSNVGAGDSSLAGFLYGCCKSLSAAECVRHAAACGTATVTLEGTGLVTRELMEKMLPKIRIST